MTITWAMLTNEALPPVNDNGTFNILGAFGAMGSPQFPVMFTPVFLCGWMALSKEESQAEQVTVWVTLTHEDGSVAGKWEQMLNVTTTEDDSGVQGPISLPLYKFTAFKPGKHIVAIDYKLQRLWSTVFQVIPTTKASHVISSSLRQPISTA